MTDTPTVYLTIAHDNGKLIPGPGMSMDEATQAAAKMLAEQYGSWVQRAEAAERERDTLRESLHRAVGLIDAMMTNDPNEPVSDAGHTALDAWKYETESLRAALEAKP